MATESPPEKAELDTVHQVTRADRLASAQQRRQEPGEAPLVSRTFVPGGQPAAEYGKYSSKYKTKTNRPKLVGTATGRTLQPSHFFVAASLGNGILTRRAAAANRRRRGPSLVPCATCESLRQPRRWRTKMASATRTVHDLPDRLAEALCAAWPLDRWLDTPVLVGVSGGADSVALLRLIDRLKRRHGGPGTLHVAHFDHGLRGREGAGDGRAVARLAAELGWPCHRARARRSGRAGAGGAASRSEAALRQIRYRYLVHVAQAHGCRYVAVAHTADDQVETVLHHVFRGTGLRGLAGMSVARPLAPGLALVRPLLGVRRRHLVELLVALGQPFRRDPSNDDLRYARNRLRHELLPRLERWYGGRVTEAVTRLAQLSAEADDVIESVVEPLLARLVAHEQPQAVGLAGDALVEVPDVLVRPVLRQLWLQRDWPSGRMGHAHWKALARLTREPNEQVLWLPGRICAGWEGNRFWLRADR